MIIYLFSVKYGAYSSRPDALQNPSHANTVETFMWLSSEVHLT